MNEKSVFNTGINYDSYFKKNISQSGFNLRLTQLIKEMLREMKDEVYSDTYECSEVIASKEELVNWALSQEKKPKGSDLIVVSVGPMTGTWRVKSEVLSSSEDIIKISGTSTSGESSLSNVFVKIGEKLYAPDENGMIDISDALQNEEGQTVIQIVNSVKSEFNELTNEVTTVKSEVQEVIGKTTNLETTVSENTQKVTKVEADLTEVHDRIDGVQETVSTFDSRIAQSEEKAEEAITKVKELEPSVISNTEKINYLDEKLDEDELSQLNEAIEITPDA